MGDDFEYPAQLGGVFIKWTHRTWTYDRKEIFI